MIDLKLSKKQKHKMEPTTANDSDGPEYPYGLMLDLDGALIEKLKLGKVKAGDDLHISAIARVKNKHSDEGEAGKDMRLSLQLVKMECGDVESEKMRIREAAAKTAWEDDK